MKDFTTILTTTPYLNQLRVLASLANWKILDSIDRGCDIKIPNEKIIAIFDPTLINITADLVASYESNGHAIGQYIVHKLDDVKSCSGFFDITNNKKYLWHEHMYTEFLKLCFIKFTDLSYLFPKLCFCCSYDAFESNKYLLPYAHRKLDLSDTRFPNQGKDDQLIIIYDNTDFFYLVVLETEKDVNNALQVFSSIEKFVISLPPDDRKKLSTMMRASTKKYFNFLFVEAVHKLLHKLLLGNIKTETDFLNFVKHYQAIVGIENMTEIQPILQFLSNCILSSSK